MKVAFNEQMACQVLTSAWKMSAHKQGRYVDLKAHPDRTAELPEAKEWPALGEFIAGVNRSKSLLHIGMHGKRHNFWRAHGTIRRHLF